MGLKISFYSLLAEKAYLKLSILCQVEYQALTHSISGSMHNSPGQVVGALATLLCSSIV